VLYARPVERAVTDILGISAFYHDSAACLLRDGKLIAAAQEERFTRKKHYAGFPSESIRYCLSEGRIALRDVRYIAFYDKPLVKFERLLETYVAFAPRGLRSFMAAMPIWVKEKLFQKNLLQTELLALTDGLKKSQLPQLLFGEHHESHAASAFLPSPFETAAVLCMDGVGEWATTSAWSYFDYCTGLTMTNRKFDALFGGPPRKPETFLTQREMDLARSIQEVTEEVMLRLSR